MPFSFKRRFSRLSTNQRIIYLATITLVGFPLVGWLILILAGGPPFVELFRVDTPLIYQVIVGLAIGTVTGWGAWIIIQHEAMVAMRQKYSRQIGQFKLTPLQIIYVSLCAGVGEEILFRGVIQPYLGIWITAVLFVAIHGYLNPKNKMLFFYGLYMTLVIALIGLLAEDVGLYTAMIAHAAIDVVLLIKMTKQERDETLDPENALTDDNGE